MKVGYLAFGYMVVVMISGLFIFLDDDADFPQLIHPGAQIPIPHHWVIGAALFLGAATIIIYINMEVYKCR